MRKQTLSWTALPNGVVAGKLRLSVFITPRLETDEGLPKPMLAQFPDFLNWPATAINFAVQIGANPAVPATRIGPLPRSDLWQALFTNTTFVRPHQFDPYGNRRIWSYPARHVMGFLKNRYLQIAKTSPEEHVDAQILIGRESFGDIGFFPASPTVPDREAQIIAQIEQSFQRPSMGTQGTGTQGIGPQVEGPVVPVPVGPAGAPDEQWRGGSVPRVGPRGVPPALAIPPSLVANPPTDLVMTKLFHRPRNLARIPLMVPEFDFHQAIGALGEFPRLLRELGLVHDLEVPLPPGLPLNTTVQVIPTWTPSIPNGVTFSTVNSPPTPALRTRCIIRVDAFLPAPSAVEPQLMDGFLRLNDPGMFELIQVDVDGAVQKVLNFANNLQRALSFRHRSADTPTQFSVPSLRSGGLSAIRVGRAWRLAHLLLEATNRHDRLGLNLENVLDAEDITRGYYVDVWDDHSAQWHSLAARHGTYQFLNNNAIVMHDDEGAASMGTTRAADNSSPDLYLQESLFRWDGWSLAVPRPGKVMDGGGAPANVPNTPLTEFKLQTSFVPIPGTLPRLRFGWKYRLRARAADLAGNAVPLGPTGPSTGEEIYGRFEPIGWPILLLKQPNTPGVSVDRMVIHSNFNSPAMDIAERHVAPPKTSQTMAEMHGLFDTPSILDKGAYNLIISREAGSFSEGGAADGTSYLLPYFPVDNLKLPYLPDLLSRGASFRGLPGQPPGASLLVDFGYSAAVKWPNASPFRLMLVEADAPASAFDPVARVLKLTLPKGDMARIRYSSYIELPDLGLMGIWQWIDTDAGVSPALKDLLRSLALRGMHWMLTPFRELVVVHAVQQPLKDPAFVGLMAERVLGQTYATLKDMMSFSRKSTIRVDILAEWTEPIDALPRVSWEVVPASAKPAEVPVAQTSPLGDGQLELDVRHEFGDTKYRRVTYTAVATSRFAEYFRRRALATLIGVVPQTVDVAGVVPDSDVVKKSDGSVTYQRTTDYVFNYPAGTIMRTATSSIPSGTQVQVEYLPAIPFARSSPPPGTTVDVLNAARPAAPRVLYAIPTFGWSSTTTANQVTSIRRGNGLRVYMDRPWFSSGDGELLGVVIWDNPSGGIIIGVPSVPDRLKPFVTQWGMDPLWQSVATKALPSLGDFPAALPDAKQSSLTLEEISGDLVEVAGHAVGYDPDRRLWYSDIEIDAGNSYFPFVRLALVRYQPKSIKNAHLSPVTLTDFVQLTPDRMAVITVNPGQQTVQAAVVGRSYQESAQGHGPSEIQIQVEVRQPNVPGDLGWVPAPNFLFTLTPGPGPSGTTIWADQITLPGPRGSQPFRLVIREYELYVLGGLTGIPAKRLVYADTIEL